MSLFSMKSEDGLRAIFRSQSRTAGRDFEQPSRLPRFRASYPSVRTDSVCIRCSPESRGIFGCYYRHMSEASERKQRTWAGTRELDRRALALLAQGMSLDAAYRKAMDEMEGKAK